MNAPSQTPVRCTVLFVCTDPTLVRRNGLVGKLRALGINVAKEILAESVRRVDVKGVDAVIALSDGLGSAARGAVRAAAGDAPLFWVGHQTTGPGWLALRDWANARPVSPLIAAPQATAHVFPLHPVPAAKDDYQSLAEAYAAENDKLKAEVTKLRADLADAPKAVATIGRLESERARNAKTIEEQAAALKRAAKDLEIAHAELERATNRAETAEREWNEVLKANRERTAAEGNGRSDKLVAAESRVLALVAENPGIGTGELQARARTGATAVVMLIDRGQITAREERRADGTKFRAHYLATAKPAPEPEPETAKVDDDEAGAALEKLVALGRISPSEAFARLRKAGAR